MKSSLRWIFLAAFLAAHFGVQAQGSMLRVACEGDAVRAEISINGVFKGECPLDIQVKSGAIQLRALKKIDASREQVFDDEFRMGEGVVKKVEVILSAARFNPEGQRREDARLAAERAEAQKRLAEREARQRADLEATLAMARQQGAEVGNGKPFRDCADCPDMLLIPPGSFAMGSNDGGANLKPVHRVGFRNSFALGRTEVTQAQWRAIMGNNPSQFKNCGDSCPVENVSWDDAQAFIQKLNARTGKQYRLPSEAEWEYACRAGGRQEYCGSDDLGSVAWYGAYANPTGNSEKKTNPVASKQANAFGLYDMSGNVWEWVADSYHDGYAGSTSDGSAWLENGNGRVIRGGSFADDPQFARAAERLENPPTHHNGARGFRLARMFP